jgi:hypothetical protein
VWVHRFAGFGFIGGLGSLWRSFIPSKKDALVEQDFSFRTVIRLLVWLVFLFQRRWAAYGACLN